MMYQAKPQAEAAAAAVEPTPEPAKDVHPTPSATAENDQAKAELDQMQKELAEWQRAKRDHEAKNKRMGESLISQHRANEELR